MSDDLKRSGGFVPGIRPGKETSDFLDTVMSHITFPGSFIWLLYLFFQLCCEINWNATGMGTFLWRHFITNYGWSCN